MNITDKINDILTEKPGDGFFKYMSKNLFKRFGDHNITQTAGQLAFFTLLSFFPFVVFLNYLISSFNLTKNVVIELLSEIFPYQIAEIMGNYVEYVSGLGNNVGIISAGIIVAVFSASRSVRALSIAINQAYNISDKRFFLLRLILSMIFTVVLGIIVMLCLVAVTAGREWIYRIILLLDLPVSWLTTISTMKWVVVFSAFFVILLLIYYTVPLTRVKLKDILPGTFLTIIFNFVLTYGYSIYISYFSNFSVLYGSMGVALLLALWLYFMGIFIILGAEFNSALAERKYFNAVNSVKN
ncbi:MAG: YihY/virulence factor BrkB family protein [Clostridia bacterium]|nr:YihY/virulence factor BrkB family protein [Clostridia bacterium]